MHRLEVVDVVKRLDLVLLAFFDQFTNLFLYTFAVLKLVQLLLETDLGLVKLYFSPNVVL